MGVMDWPTRLAQENQARKRLNGFFGNHRLSNSTSFPGIGQENLGNRIGQGSARWIDSLFQVNIEWNGQTGPREVRIGGAVMVWPLGLTVSHQPSSYAHLWLWQQPTLWILLELINRGKQASTWKENICVFFSCSPKGAGDIVDWTWA